MSSQKRTLEGETKDRGTTMFDGEISIDGTTYSAQVPSPQLEAFLPVVLVGEQGGCERQMFVEFEGTVKYPPIKGAYGNFIPSADGQQ